MISDKMKDLVKNSSAIRAMFEEGKRMAAERGAENVFDFSLGNPSINPPESVNEAFKVVIDEESPITLHGYMLNSGFEDVRQSVADYINTSFGTKLGVKNIIMTVGAAGGLNVILKTLLNPGDEVVVAAPYFGEYNNYISNFDGKRVVVSPDYDTFSINLEELEQKLTPKTKCMIINSPNNPSGAVYSEEDIKKLAAILESKEKEFGTSIYLIADEPYREIVFNGAEVPYLTRYYHNAIVGYSFSKSLSLPGERIGYIVVPDEVDDFEEMVGAMSVANRILGFVNAPALQQKVIAKLIGQTADVSVYAENERILYKALTEYGYEVVEPKGSFYMFPKSPIADDKQFCEDAKQFGLIVVPGSSFSCPGYFRIAFCVGKEKLEAALPAFKKAIELYK
jgi:aspartate aminotransferase